MHWAVALYSAGHRRNGRRPAEHGAIAHVEAPADCRRMLRRDIACIRIHRTTTQNFDLDQRPGCTVKLIFTA
jgi:hypothetical protein